MPLITLTTDFGTKDFSVSALKGKLYREMKAIDIIDITHEIAPFNTSEAAYIIKGSYKNFPKGTIHIIGVATEKKDDDHYIIAEIEEQYFICANNGVLALIANDNIPTKIISIEIFEKQERNFPVLDIFIDVALLLIKGKKIESFGKKIDYLKKILYLNPNILNKEKIINGHVIYIDNYGNAITNITKKIFEEVGAGYKYRVLASRYRFEKINKNYSNGELLLEKNITTKIALFNSMDFLELTFFGSSIDQAGSAASLLGLKIKTPVTVEFFP